LLRHIRYVEPPMNLQVCIFRRRGAMQILPLSHVACIAQIRHVTCDRCHTKCGLSVCLSVYWSQSHGCALQKRLSRSRCCLGRGLIHLAQGIMYLMGQGWMNPLATANGFVRLCCVRSRFQIMHIWMVNSRDATSDSTITRMPRLQ